MSHPHPASEGLLGQEENRSAKLLLVEMPKPAPSAPQFFPFRVALIIATAVLGSGAFAASLWLLPVLLVQEEGFEAPPVQIRNADFTEAKRRPAAPRVARLRPLLPPAPQVRAPILVASSSWDPVAQVAWEGSPEEPYDPSELIEEAEVPFPTAKEEPKVSKAPPKKRTPAKTRRPSPRPEGSPKPAVRDQWEAARIKRRYEPNYPLSARRSGAEGRVMVTLEIQPTGRVGAVRVARSSGHALLDSALVSAVKRWSFYPAKKNGKPVASTVNVPYRFLLQ